MQFLDMSVYRYMVGGGSTWITKWSNCGNADPVFAARMIRRAEPEGEIIKGAKGEFVKQILTFGYVF